jgi:capsid protein
MLGSYTINCPVYGGSSSTARPRQSFDVAKTNPQNQKHWSNADRLAAVSDLTPGVRGLLRRRSRYECMNNPYASGLVSTLSNDLVGTGPRLQVHTDDDGLNSFLEQQWREWSDATMLAGKLRLMDETRQRDGECFGVFFRNVMLEEDGLPCLDVKLIEGDQVAHPYGIGWWDNPTGDDGVICDENGLPKSYLMLKVHPGDQRNLRGRFLADELPARDVLHWFRPKRPGQLRGYPELTAALPMFAYLRRIDLAALCLLYTSPSPRDH